MRKETLQVCFGCLLHDIGKLVYRAGGESGSHSRQGGDFLRQLWPEEREILDCVRLHHAAELRQAQPRRTARPGSPARRTISLPLRTAGRPVRRSGVPSAAFSPWRAFSAT